MKKLMSSLSLGAFVAVSSAASIASSIQLTDLTTQGDAAFNSSNSKIVLTTAGNSQAGWAFSDQQFGVSTFNAEFELWLGSKDGNGADGIVFGFFDTNTPGNNNGGSMGYSSSLGGFGIEFDTWYNSNNVDPVNSDHIALVKPSASGHGSKHLAYTATDNLEIGAWLGVAVERMANSINVTLSGGGLNETFSTLLAPTSQNGYFGFMAATGGANNLQKVRDLQIVVNGTGGTGISPVPVPAAAWLFATGIAGLVGFRRRAKGKLTV